MTYEVVFSPEALGDLLKLYNDIADGGGPARAQNYPDQIVALCRRLDLFPKRGTRRDDLRPNLRITTFRRRVTIAYHIDGTRVVIDRIFYGGRDLTSIFGDDADDDPEEI